jgi:hypothetical protein
LFTRKIEIAKGPYFIGCFAMIETRTSKILRNRLCLGAAAHIHQEYRSRASRTARRSA